jgi:hypothetical protein
MKHGRGKLILRDNESGLNDFSVIEAEFVENKI